MKAAVLTKVDSPWELTTLPDPKPGPGQVLIRIRASGMCGTDLHFHRGHVPAQLPLVLGHEPAGEIVEVGAGVNGLEVGDRVGASWVQKGCGRCRTCREGRPVYCAKAQTWVNLGGGNAELMLAWGTGCTRIPDGLAYEEAAPVFCAGYTVMSGLRNADPRPGDRVAVLGLGGLGHLAVQYSKALGLETLVLTGNASKKEEAKKLGADGVVVGGSDFGKALKDAGGADVVLGTTNSALQATQTLAGLRPEGRFVNMGLVDGPIAADSVTFLVGQIRLVGSQQNDRRDLVEALELHATGKAKCMLEVSPLSKVNEVRERFEAGKVRYRSVLTP